MPLSLAGINLGPPGPAVLEWIEKHFDLAEACPWTRRSWPGKNLTGIPWSTGYRGMPRRIRPNVMRWGPGASNFAYGFFVATSNEADAIRSAAFGTGTTTTPITLRITSPGIKSILDATLGLSASVYMMPPVPLGRVARPGGSYLNGLYLLPVVDQRFYWWQVLTPDFAIDGQTTTWTSVFTAIGTALGLSVDVDSISSNYRLPDVGLNLSGEVLPPVFDACCKCIGMELVVDYSGAVSVISQQGGLKRRQFDDSTHTTRTLISGGDEFNTNL